MEPGPESGREPIAEHEVELELEYGSGSRSDPGVSTPETSLQSKGIVVVTELNLFRAFWISSFQFSISYTDCNYKHRYNDNIHVTKICRIAQKEIEITRKCNSFVKKLDLTETDNSTKQIIASNEYICSINFNFSPTVASLGL